MFDWVTLKKAADESGYTTHALRSKIKRGQLVEEIHWRKASDGRILINVPNFASWLNSNTVI
jgi:hypothetical protein